MFGFFRKSESVPEFKYEEKEEEDIRYVLDSKKTSSHVPEERTLDLGAGYGSSPSMDALRHDVLRGRLIQALVTQQFQRAFGANSWQLTTEPLLKSSGDRAEQIISPLGRLVPGPSSYPPVIRAFYYRFLRSMSVFAGNGRDWVSKGEGWIEHESVVIFYKWLRATQFDLLNFTTFYLSLFNHLKNQGWYGSIEDPRLLNDYYPLPCTLPTHLYPSFVSSALSLLTHDRLVSQYKSKSRGGGSFRIHKRLSESESTRNDVTVISMRRIKLEAFAKAWGEFTELAGHILRDEIKQSESAHIVSFLNPSAPQSKVSHVFVSRFWQVCANSPTIEDLPPIWKKFISVWMRAFALIIDNIFDDPKWRKKMDAIWKGIPMNIILSSLRLVNPIPFMDQMIKLFCWRPLGMDSLLQRLGAVLSATSKTNQELQEAGKRVSHGDTNKIKLEYALFYLRKREKDEFVSALGDNKVVEFIKHIASIIPPILSELWKCTNFHKLATNFVATVDQTLKVLSRYDTCVGPTEHIHAFPGVVSDLTGHFEEFMAAAWPMVHQLSKRPPDGPAGLQAFADWFFSEIIMPVTSLPGADGTDDRDPIVTIASDTDFVLSRLDEEKKKILWTEVDEIIRLMEKGVDDGEWRRMEVLEGDACGLFGVYIMSQCLGGATARDSRL
ncbi:hypothetical protein PROFUN_16146 [Planoprotostelium fungivorum]|uniref:PX domain-containing protein n=1 Tax=Planoprotostelium fungivorum TaxID=1890364 RepID=A0A2P6MSP4_9EUKA|nr:hypothetical protein PROFUN_16146 [Planoprotostelium fungivorum]